MSGRSIKAVKIASLALGALVAAGTAAPISEAAAQGLFGSIFGNLGMSHRQARTYAPAYAPSYHMDDRYSDSADRPRSSGSYAGGSGTYCVRLCDGRYFPIPRVTGQVSAVKVCNAMCPMAQTKVFNGSDPTKSVASDGARYDDLDNALVFREKIVPDCTCTGNGPGGLARIDIESDPTLRAGDVVATTTGLKAFTGGNGYPHKSADFTPVGSYAKISADVRQKLSELKINETVHSTAPVQSLATASPNEGQAEAKPRKRVRAQAVIDARTRQVTTWHTPSWSDFWR